MGKSRWMKKRYLILLGALLGLAAFLVLYGPGPINPANDRWIWYGYDETDIHQHYAGWLGYRNSSWQYPLGQADALAYPCTEGVNITFTDAIPWVSVFFKLFARWLPATFQWFGLYELAAFMLQGAAAALILGMFLNSLLSVGVGTVLYVFSPIMIERAFRHVSLSSHYLVLFALYFYLRGRRENRCFRSAFWFLAVLAVGITPYFLPMVAVFALLLAIDQLAKRRGVVAPVMLFAGTCAAGYLGGVVLGALNNGYGSSREGYGSFSMNLNAVINPRSCGNYTWSRILPQRPQLYGQYDGFNYLGVGILALVLITGVLVLAAAVRSKAHRTALAGLLRRNAVLLGGMVFLTLFAVSNVLCFDDHELLQIPLPDKLLELCGIFRASGRLFYPVFYVLLTAGIVGLYRLTAHWRKKEKIFPLVLAAFAALQLFDLSAMIAEKHTAMAEMCAKPAPYPQELRDRAGEYRVLFLSDDIIHARNILMLALRPGMVTNAYDVNTYTGAWNVTIDWTAQARAEADEGTLYPDMLYVTSDADRLAKWQELYAGRADFITWNIASTGIYDRCDTYYFMLPEQ